MGPYNHRQTLRQEIINLLSSEELTLRDLSQKLGIPEKEVIGHLEHIERSVRSLGKKLLAIPHKCLSCGFVFDGRNRFSKPGRCPSCKNSHIEVAQYHISGDEN